jgi:hypothetical protein
MFIFITGTRLIATHYGRLCEKIKPCASHWKFIAASLSFTYNEIINIEANPRNVQSNSFLNDVIGVWLNWAPGDGRGSKDYATLEHLQTAVSKAGCGLIASELTMGELRPTRILSRVWLQ